MLTFSRFRDTNRVIALTFIVFGDFGMSKPLPRSANSKSKQQGAYEYATESAVLEQNDEALDLLSSHVERMKMLSMEIGQDAEEHLSLIDRAVSTTNMVTIRNVSHSEA